MQRCQGLIITSILVNIKKYTQTIISLLISVLPIKQLYYLYIFISIMRSYSSILKYKIITK